MNYSKVLGIIGGGQLGRMLCYKASLLGFKTYIYSDISDFPAKTFCDKYKIGSFDDTAKILDFAAECDFITIEFENIDVKSLKLIEKTFPTKLSPNSNAVYIASNRFREKTFAFNLGIKTPYFNYIKTQDDLLFFYNKIDRKPFMVKTCELGYDGKGQFSVQSIENLPNLDFTQTYIAEEKISFDKEISVILVRNRVGHIYPFPVPTNTHENGILIRSSLTENLSADISKKAIEAASKIAHELNYVGVLAVEFFVLGENVIFNEIAPRVHNSGHFTQDLCNICQFENHVRAVCDLPIIQPHLVNRGLMVNLIGKNFEIDYKNPLAKIHLYGKNEAKDGRKMGHINYIIL